MPARMAINFAFLTDYQYIASALTGNHFSGVPKGIVIWQKSIPSNPKRNYYKSGKNSQYDYKGNVRRSIFFHSIKNSALLDESERAEFFV